jgi:hypothetical protein
MEASMLTTLNSFITHALGMTGIAFLATLGAGVLASPITADEVEQFFVRYMANGRSNVEMQYRLSESDAYASGEHSDDRVHMSMIALYEVPEKIKLETEYLKELGKRWLFIHESQHALILPHLNPQEPSPFAPIGAWVQFRLVQQTHENAADARAIARIWKIDGSEGARELAAAVIQFRDGDGPGHQTQCAIRAMVATLDDDPELVASDVDEFQFVLDTAERCAIVTANRLLAENVGAASASAIMQLPAVLETLENIHTVLGRVASDYESGRFKNTAATIRFGTIHRKSSPQDYHFYVGADNVVTRDTVLGGEGARGKEELEEAMRVPGSPERFFAVEGVKKIGNVTRDKLSDTEIVFKRFVDVFAGTCHERRARAYNIIADVIKNIDRREHLGALYTEVNRRLMFELGYPSNETATEDACALRF